MLTKDDVYMSERIYKEILASNSGLPISLRLDKAMKESPNVNSFIPSPEVLNLPAYLNDCPLSSRTYNNIRVNFTKLKDIEVTDLHFIEAKNYVDELLGPGLLENVSYTIVPIELWDRIDSSEAFANACGDDEHHIYIPSKFSSPVELLCHELGHAAHYTARRRSGKYSSLFNFTISTEFVAHFVQYNYILERLPRIYFHSAIPQVIQSAYAHTILQYGINEGGGNLTDYETFKKSKTASEIFGGWWNDALDRVYPEFANNIPHLQHYAQRNLAMCLAFIFLSEKEGMRQFIYLDDGEKSIDNLLGKCFPRVDLEMAWSMLDDVIDSLFSINFKL